MSAYTDVMLDLETLGTAPGSVILSIGAVAFAEGMPEAEWSKFEARPIKVKDSRVYGLTIDESTLAWWMRQDADARGLLDCALDGAGGFTLHSALIEFSDWFPEGAKLWGNGANFDNVLLRAAYDALTLNLNTPWAYYDDRCFRTMKKAFTAVPEPEFLGVKHDALADALHQTRWLQAIWKHKCAGVDADKDHAELAKARAEMVKVNAELTKAYAEHAKVCAKVDKTRAEWDKAYAELVKARAEHAERAEWDKVRAEWDKVSTELLNGHVELDKARTEVDKVRDEWFKADAEFAKARSECAVERTSK